MSFLLGDLTDVYNARAALAGMTRSISLQPTWAAPDTFFTGEHDAAVMHDSATINLTCWRRAARRGEEVLLLLVGVHLSGVQQMDPRQSEVLGGVGVPCRARSEYGWEKLFSERLYFAYHRNFGVQVRVARFHNILAYWARGAAQGEVSPRRSAVRSPKHQRAARSRSGGDGKQTRSFLFVEECVEGIRRLVESDFPAR